jgi:hypothetical protein
MNTSPNHVLLKSACALLARVDHVDGWNGRKGIQVRVFVISAEPPALVKD